MDFEIKKIKGIKRVRKVNIPLYKHRTLKRLYHKELIQRTFETGVAKMKPIDADQDSNAKKEHLDKLI